MSVEDIKNNPMTETFYDFMDMCQEITKILGYNPRNCGKHFYPETGSFDEWCDSKKYGKKDPEGKHRNSSQIWYSEYKKDIQEEKWKDVPYMDFWHWQLDHCVGHDFGNDRYSTINIHPDCAKDAQNWQKEIQQVWWETFKDIADKNGVINIWVCW